jgi:hypothetical protein
LQVELFEILPEVAVTTTWAAPLGVKGAATPLVLEHPAMKLRVVRQRPKMAKSLIARAADWE